MLIILFIHAARTVNWLMQTSALTLKDDVFKRIKYDSRSFKEIEE